MNTFVSFVLERFKFDSRMNENHTVAAGLTFSAQLLSLLSACFDTLLPKRLHFSDFGIPSKTEFKFYKLISRLNLVILNLLLSMLTRPFCTMPNVLWTSSDSKKFIFFQNIVYLCLVQGINPSELRPKQFLHNLYVLFDHVKKGDLFKPFLFRSKDNRISCFSFLQ